MNTICKNCMLAGGCSLKQFKIDKCWRNIDNNLSRDEKTKKMAVLTERFVTRYLTSLPV